MFYPAFLDVLYYVGAILESLTSNITGNGDPTCSSIHYSLVSPIPKFFPPKVQALFVLLHLMIILYCLFWSSSLKHLTNAAHFLLDETIFSLCFHNMNFTQFSAYLSSHCFWSPLLAPAFPRLHFFWIMAILKALLEPSSLFSPASQEFLLFAKALCAMQIPVPSKLNSSPILYFPGPDSQSQLPSEHLHRDALLIKLDLPILFLPKVFFFQMPLSQQMAQPSTCHSIKILRLICKLLLSLCPLSHHH